jgi:hypothetical protein
VGYSDLMSLFGANAYFPLNETSGTIAHELVSSTNGTIGSNVTVNNSSIMAFNSPSFAFTGSSGGVVTIAPLNSYGSAPSQFGFYQTALTPYIVLWMESSLPKNAYLVYFNSFHLRIHTDGSLETQVNTSNGSPYGYVLTGPTSLFDGSRHCIVLQVSAQTYTNSFGPGKDLSSSLWIDGVKITTPGLVGVGGYPNQWLSADAASIGCFNDGSKAFNGKISQVGILSTTLSDDAIQRIYISGTTLPLTSSGIYFSDIFKDAPLSSRVAEPPINSPKRLFSTEVLPFLPLVETLNFDLYKYMQRQGLCASTPAPIYVYPANTSINVNTTVTPNANFALGYYYRCPVGDELIDGQSTPKYDGYFARPYVAVLYPPGDIYQGHMLIKSLSPINNPPGDIYQLIESVVASDIQRIAASVFAL